MGKFDDDRQAFLPIFWSNITERQRQDYELAKKHFGPLYRVQDTNYFMKKFKEYQANPTAFPIKELPKTAEVASNTSSVTATVISAAPVTVTVPIPTQL